MILKRGNIKNLRGNAVVYWDIEENNFLTPDFEVFAINFVISSLNLDEKLLTAIFPLTPFKDLAHLFHHLNNRECDILYGGRLYIPESKKEFKDFYKQEIQKYNQLVEEYIGFYKNKVSLFNSSEIEKLYLLKNLIQKLSHLQVDSYEDKNLSSKMIQILDHLDKNTKYDLKQFRYVLSGFCLKSFKRKKHLLNLYVDKFLAIYYEDYETANSLKNKIKEMIE